MSLRDLMAKKPGVTAAAVSVLLACCLAWVVYNLLPDKPAGSAKAFFSDDDGKTYFADSDQLVPPFDRDGKQVVRAVVFTCGDRKTPFIGYLERYTPDVKRRLDASATGVAGGKAPTFTMGVANASMGGIEFKKPGDAKWTPGNDFATKQKLFKSLCPGGGVVDTVLP